MAWDQPDNGLRVSKLGVGQRLGRRQRTAGHLGRALEGLRSPEVLARCRAVAGMVGEVDGLEVAAGLVEELAANGSKKSRLTEKD